MMRRLLTAGAMSLAAILWSCGASCADCAKADDGTCDACEAKAATEKAADDAKEAIDEGADEAKDLIDGAMDDN